MNQDEYDALWRCGYCDRWYVVPPLARACEAKHEGVCGTGMPDADEGDALH